jgi:hypothetical protein
MPNMYATLRRVKIHPGAAAEISRRVEEAFVPLVSKLTGFVAFYLVDQGESMATFSVFADQAGAEQANLQAAAWVRENLAELIASPLELGLGEVTIHKVM